MCAAAAARIHTAEEHAVTLHADRHGSVALAQKVAGEWHEQAYAADEIAEALCVLGGHTDVYLSIQRFFGWRRIAKLAELGALVVDLDYYRAPKPVGALPNEVLDEVLEVLEGTEVPAPSLAISSGRGLYLLWLHSPVPRSALPRWNSCQAELYGLLKPLGADAAAKDAARVLRAIGTRNSKTGTMVEALAPTGEIYDFDELADRVLPFTRAEIYDLRVQRAAKRARRGSERLWTPPAGFTEATLWEARLTDLQTLRRLRWSDGPMPDFRDRWLFLAGVAMSHIAPPVALQRELYALAKEAGGWTEGKTRSKMHAVFRTAKAAFDGEKVEFQGKRLDPRYRFTNETLVQWLEITPDEEREMRTIYLRGERLRRDRERKERERRNNGVRSRAEVAERRRAEAQALRTEGLTQTEIAGALGVSQQAVSLMLRQGG